MLTNHHHSRKAPVASHEPSARTEPRLGCSTTASLTRTEGSNECGDARPRLDYWATFHSRRRGLEETHLVERTAAGSFQHHRK